MNDLHGIVFTYRSDPNLGELTRHRSACSIPYGGRYRLVDFMLSNLVNAGVTDVGLIVHSSYQSLLDHLGSGKDWDLSRKRGGLRILPPFGYSDKSGGYVGRMDALASVRSYLQQINQEYVILFNDDTIANLPVEEIFQQHLDSGADITAVCTRTPIADPKETNYFTLGAQGTVTDVSIHPQTAMGCESMEVYILSKNLLLSMVDHCTAHNIHSFSEGVLQPMCGTLRIVPYFFEGYAARICSPVSYYTSSMDLLKSDVRADLFNPARPIRTKDRSDPSTYYSPESVCVNSLVADGCIIEGEVTNSIIFRGVKIAKGARVSNCILLQGTSVGEGAVLNYAITDKDVTVNAGRMLMGHETYPIVIAKNAIV